MVRQEKKVIALLATGLMISLAACDGAQTETGDGEAPPPVDEQASQPKMAPPPIGGQTSQPKGERQLIGGQVSKAKEDLATRLSVDTSAITEESVRLVQWRSGAKGCPNPEMSYTMAIQPGWLILLNVNGETYRYHAGRNGLPFYCPADRAEAPAMGLGEEVM